MKTIKLVGALTFATLSEKYVAGAIYEVEDDAAAVLLEKATTDGDPMFELADSAQETKAPEAIGDGTDRSEDAEKVIKTTHAPRRKKAAQKASEESDEGTEEEEQDESPKKTPRKMTVGKKTTVEI